MPVLCWSQCLFTSVLALLWYRFGKNYQSTVEALDKARGEYLYPCQKRKGPSFSLCLSKKQVAVAVGLVVGAAVGISDSKTLIFSNIVYLDENSRTFNKRLLKYGESIDKKRGNTSKQVWQHLDNKEYTKNVTRYNDDCNATNITELKKLRCKHVP